MVAKVGILHACELVKLPATEGIRSNLTLQKVDPLPQRSIFGHLLHCLDPQFPILLLAGVWLSAFLCLIQSIHSVSPIWIGVVCNMGVVQTLLGLPFACPWATGCGANSWWASLLSRLPRVKALTLPLPSMSSAVDERCRG